MRFTHEEIKKQLDLMTEIRWDIQNDSIRIWQIHSFEIIHQLLYENKVMIEALKEIEFGHTNDVRAGGSWELGPNSLRGIARAAIAKAEGESK